MKDKLLRYSVNILNVFCIIISLIFYHIFNISGNYIFYILCILFAIAGFHLCVHLGIGHIVNFILKNDVDYNKIWFLERAFEDKLYKKLRVRNWKDKIPTFYPDTFSLQNNVPIGSSTYNNSNPKLCTYILRILYESALQVDIHNHIADVSNLWHLPCNNAKI